MIRLRNQWVEMDPRGGRDSMDMTVTVGIGNGNRLGLARGQGFEGGGALLFNLLALE